MEIELRERDVPFGPQLELPLYYKGRRLKKFYVADLACYGTLIVEIKAINSLTPTEQSQI